MDHLTHVRRQGKGWIVVRWDEERGVWHESCEMDYWRARDAVEEAKDEAQMRRVRQDV